MYCVIKRLLNLPLLKFEVSKLFVPFFIMTNTFDCCIFVNEIRSIEL